MKKLLSIVAVAVFTLGLFSCETENTAEDENLYIQSPDVNESAPERRR